MRTAPLDDAASAPHDPAAQAVAEGARLWRRMGRWVGRLTKIGAELSRRMGIVADWREKTGATEGSFDLRLGWALVSRAARWTRALRARMRAVAAAEPCEVPPVRLPGFGAARDPAFRVPREPIPATWTMLGRTDCIDGLSAGEVVAQICADLADAATLLRAAKAGKAIARIAKAARAVLAEPGETWTKLPPPRLWDLPSAAKFPARPDAPTGLPAPDTG